MKTEKNDNYLINQTDLAITELVFDKLSLIKAYNYYSGIRDKDQFNHLESNYGLGNPTSITFIPLIRKHIDSLIGEFLSLPVFPKISCKDKGTLTNIFRDKQLEITKSIISILKTKLENSIYSSLKGDSNTKIDDTQLKIELEETLESIENNFISNYEIAAQNIVTYLIQSKDIDFKNKLKILISDLLISGETYYAVKKTSGETNIDIEVRNPLNSFIERNVKSIYLKKSFRSVHREWLSKSEILVKYGKHMSADDREELEKCKVDYSSSNLMMIKAVNNRTGALLSDGILSGIDATPLYTEYPTANLTLYPVYEVEWIDTDKDDKQWRYSTVRIGQELYILEGKDENSIRSIDSPKETCLNMNGIYFTSRTGKPYSLVLETADLQDKSDILHFFRDNLFANSGTIGSWIDVAHLPTFLGDNVPEQLIKWLGYAKSGLKLYDTSQEGEMLNTAFNTFDDTIKINAMQAFDLALQRIEETASSITGVFRERLGGIEARDAVQNVTMGMQQSYIITKQYYQVMELLTREMLIDSLNLAKTVYKKGLSGLLILGDNRRQIFTALPEHYSVTDFDIHIADSTELLKEKELLKQLVIQLSSNNQVDPELLLIVSTSKSITELKISMEKNLKRKKEENNQLQKLNEAYQQAQEQLKQMQQELEKSSQQIKQLDSDKLALGKQKLKQDYELGILKITTDKDYKGKMTELEKRRVELEALQLIDNNPKNDEIKNT
jgi:hypothetical protein